VPRVSLFQISQLRHVCAKYYLNRFTIRKSYHRNKKGELLIETQCRSETTFSAARGFEPQNWPSWNLAQPIA